MTQINLLFVFAAAIANNLTGALWYSPFLFGKTWLDLMKTRDGFTTEVNALRSYGGSFIAALIIAFFLALGIQLTGRQTIAGGVSIGLYSWLGFVLPTQGMNALYGGRKGVWVLFFIDTGFHLAAFLIMGAILGGLM